MKLAVVGVIVVAIMCLAVWLGLRDGSQRPGPGSPKAPTATPLSTPPAAVPVDPAPAAGAASRPPVRRAAAPEESSKATPQGSAATATLPVRPPRSAAEVDGLVQTLRNDGVALDDRRRAATALAQDGSPAALFALGEILRNPSTPAALRAAVAEALGQCADPAAREMIHAVLDDRDENVVRGAIRGLAALRNPADVAVLQAMLNAPDRSVGVRGAAAEALGAIPGEEAYTSLVAAFQNPSPATAAVLSNILAGLGQRDIAETRAFFQDVILGENTPAPVRADAIRALHAAAGEAGAFLTELLVKAEPAARTDVAWALAAAPPGELGTPIMDVARFEDDASVRKTLYQALLNQRNVDLKQATELVLAETDAEARLAGYAMLAYSMPTCQNPAVVETFDRVVVRELETLAVGEGGVETRLAAVAYLSRARTAAASAALARIGQSAADPQVSAAAQAALKR